MSGALKLDTTSPYPGEWQIVEGGEGADVPVIKLDDEFAARRVGLIHLDVEGFEENAIRGAELIISRCRPLFMIEIHGDAAKTDRLLALGYRQAWAGENNAFLTTASGQAVTRSNSTA
ncbi:FkbM family methyltransferase [Pseudomonadota bacterium]